MGARRGHVRILRGGSSNSLVPGTRLHQHRARDRPKPFTTIPPTAIPKGSGSSSPRSVPRRPLPGSHPWRTLAAPIRWLPTAPVEKPCGFLAALLCPAHRASPYLSHHGPTRPSACLARPLHRFALPGSRPSPCPTRHRPLSLPQRRPRALVHFHPCQPPPRGPNTLRSTRRPTEPGAFLGRQPSADPTSLCRRTPSRRPRATPPSDRAAEGTRGTVVPPQTLQQQQQRQRYRQQSWLNCSRQHRRLRPTPPSCPPTHSAWTMNTSTRPLARCGRRMHAFPA